jgi:uncharacterized protein YeaO (DUF488 family)/DNA-binding MarR family transcriptional regulator
LEEHGGDLWGRSIGDVADYLVNRMSLSDEVYGRLLALRTGLRQFERWSEHQARAAGLTPAQHQLLLAVRGHGDTRGPTIGEVADYLLLRHHSTVGLIDRADAAGLVQRTRDEEDHRVVRLQLTELGAQRLEALSTLHLQELERLAPQLPGAWTGLAPTQRHHGFAGPPVVPGDPNRRPVEVQVSRVYDDVTASPARRVLVDRLWPRGVARSEVHIDEWVKDVAPSTELRKWYGHVPERFDEFARRYRRELDQSPACELLERLREQAQVQGMILVTATRDVAHSGAVVLQAVLADR